MNAPYSFNFKYDPILENPFRSEIDYNKEIDERVRQLQLMKDKYNSTVKQTIQSESLWNKIDNEIKSLNDDQRNILFSDKNYISIDTQLKILVQEALVNSVKDVIENSEIGNKLAAVEEFDAPTETMSSITPLLYQSGYVTIKDYDKELELYTLDIPNKEVRVGLMRSLLPYYVTNDTREATNMVAFISRDIRKGDMDAALRRLQTFLSTIPQCDHTKYEGHYQQVFYIIFSLLGYYVDVEVRTSRGRVDVVLRTEATLYVMELKLDKNATVAMEQINLKNYPERFALCGLPVVKVAVNFDSESGTLGDWMIEK